MAEFLHTAILNELKKRVKGRQQDHQARMAKGLPETAYWELVGRHKECDDLIGAIQELAETNEATLDDDDKH